MEVRISSWGTSLGVRLPKKHLDKLKLGNGDYLNIDLTPDGFKLTKAFSDNELPEEVKNMLVQIASEEAAKDSISSIEVYQRLQESGEPVLDKWLKNKKNWTILENTWRRR